jgi:hypothetical protein
MAWDLLKPDMDRSPWSFDGTHLFHIRGKGILEMSGRAITQGIDGDLKLLVQDDLQMARQLRSQGLRDVVRQTSQVEILSGLLVVVRASFFKEPGYRSARRAAIKVVDRDVWSHHWRFGGWLLCRDRLLALRLSPGRARS